MFDQQVSTAGSTVGFMQTGGFERWQFCPRDGQQLDLNWKYCPCCGIQIGSLGSIFNGAPLAPQPIITTYPSWSSGAQCNAQNQIQGTFTNGG